MNGRIIWYNFWNRKPKNDLAQPLLELTQLFLRRKLCFHGCQVAAKAHMTLWVMWFYNDIILWFFTSSYILLSLSRSAVRTLTLAWIWNRKYIFNVIYTNNFYIIKQICLSFVSKNWKKNKSIGYGYPPLSAKENRRITPERKKW